jgi:hypothetical protein
MPRLNSDELFCMLATMPRSGTWLSFFFFEYFDSFLTGRTPIRTDATTYSYAGLGITKAHAHLMCPGFVDHYKTGFLRRCKGPLRGPWDALEFKTPGINSGYGPLVENEGHRFDLLRNRRLRIAYLYRNPLDQAVSHFHALYWREKPMEPDRFRSGLSKWMRDVSIESYIKQYFTYHVMRQSHADNILCLPYEDLVRSPRENFQRITRHFGFVAATDDELRCFDKAIDATTQPSLRQLELQLGHAFAHPEVRNDSHMQGGEIGKWQRWLSEDTVQEVERRFNRFELSLRDFTLM